MISDNPTTDVRRPISWPADATMLPVSMIRADANYRRTDTAESAPKIEALAESIATLGVVGAEQALGGPPMVRPIDVDGRPILDGGEPAAYQVVCGHHRYTAMVEILGYTEIPCYVQAVSDGDAVSARLRENGLRRESTPAEEAQGCRQGREAGFTDPEIAAMLGFRHVTTVTDRLGLLTLPADLLVDVLRSSRGLSAATQLGRLTWPEGMGAADVSEGQRALVRVWRAAGEPTAPRWFLAEQDAMLKPAGADDMGSLFGDFDDYAESRAADLAELDDPPIPGDGSPLPDFSGSPASIMHDLALYWRRAADAWLARSNRKSAALCGAAADAFADAASIMPDLPIDVSPAETVQVITVEVPVDRIVERIVEVPVDRIVYVPAEPLAAPAPTVIYAARPDTCKRLAGKVNAAPMATKHQHKTIAEIRPLSGETTPSAPLATNAPAEPPAPVVPAEDTRPSLAAPEPAPALDALDLADCVDLCEPTGSNWRPGPLPEVDDESDRCFGGLPPVLSFRTGASADACRLDPVSGTGHPHSAVSGSAKPPRAVFLVRWRDGGCLVTATREEARDLYGWGEYAKQVEWGNYVDVLKAPWDPTLGPVGAGLSWSDRAIDAREAWAPVVPYVLPDR